MRKVDIAVMYHYIREQNGWGAIHPLRPEDFARQIDVILQTHEIVSVDELRMPSTKPKAIITFDDGTKDQYTYAFDILRKKGVRAYFAVMSGPRITGKIPLVHLVHAVLSFTSDEELRDILIASYDVQSLSIESSIYDYETNKLRKFNKYVLNFILKETEARAILESIFNAIFPNAAKFVKEHYISDSELIEMHRAGMTIGVHGHNHIPYYNDAQHYFATEILPCKEYLERELGIIAKWYTPPFGGGEFFHCMERDLTPILLEHGFAGGFSTISGPIDDTSRFWFPRIDCNRLSPELQSLT
ncbi:polysaccharide deacetylase family protein [Brevibacillus humidisoli]|uniref:polysaccharide deacetylase family protein n=1 Tax=Brevibacillus humidisoli TaxID=2895522 RepID=UPI001E520FAB|nr:polysaccharide deacetylase family protein [Brevibacillus humidisoli]UFJ40037.1 polysaccharide deacetylase family protein [Brevibacillus humidisoli]